MKKNIAGYDAASGSFQDYQSYRDWLETVLKPEGLKPIFENIPEELTRRDNWVTWSYVLREAAKGQKGRFKLWTKSPNGKVNDCATWTSFKGAIKQYEQGDADGIGFVFKKGDGIVGIDWDDVIDEAGNVKEMVLRAARKAKTFTELSPSGRGVHQYILANLAGGRRGKKGLEIYGDSHYFTVTGHIPEFARPWGVQEQQELADCAYKKLISSDQEDEDVEVDQDDKSRNFNVSDSNNSVIKKILASKDEKSKDLFSGDWKQYYESQSEADLGFFAKLLYWVGGDCDQADSIFRESGLMRDKWLRTGYRTATMTKALKNYKEKVSI